MSFNVDPLVVGRVIGDVIDPFVPIATMSVHYGSKHVTNGCDIKPSAANSPPKVVINGDSHELYSLVMIDPDAPSPSEPSLREYVHWIVMDIPGQTSPAEGIEILPYTGPQPPVGIHRYVLVLFQQRRRLGNMDPPKTRGRFCTRMFALQLGLGMPVATVYFNSRKEPVIKRRI
ncbi:hypothetical protein LguiA_027873 [Lonicera macranthoides]